MSLGAARTGSSRRLAAPWRAFFDRRIKQFRDVPSEDAYWSARPKPWGLQPIVRADRPAAIEIQPEQVNATLADAKVLPGYLLRWIGEHAGTDPMGHIDLAALRDDLPAEQLVPAVATPGARGTDRRYLERGILRPQRGTHRR